MRAAALLKRDGDMAGLNGTSTLNVPSLTGSYRIAIRHSNHPGDLTDVEYPLTSTPTMVDRTTAPTVTWVSDACKDVNGALVLRAGNTAPDNELKCTGSANARDPILLYIGSTLPTRKIRSYHNMDVTLDGTVSSAAARTTGTHSSEHKGNGAHQYPSRAVDVIKEAWYFGHELHGSCCG